MNEDTEFCEQLELELPAPPLPPIPCPRLWWAAGWAALLKAAESLKEVSAAPEYTKYEYFYTFTS